MNDSEFNALADEALTRIEAGLERSGADLDFAMISSGVGHFLSIKGTIAIIWLV